MEQKIVKNKTSRGTPSTDKINDPHLKEVFSILSSKNIIDPKKINLRGDAESNIRQQIKDSLNDKNQNLNETFSELRKSGKDLGVLNFKLMMLPLKIKMFLSTYEKKDLENLIIRIEEIETEINKLIK